MFNKPVFQLFLEKKLNFFYEFVINDAMNLNKIVFQN
jgi:hypothetical protein